MRAAQVGVFAPPYFCRVAFADGEKDLRRRVVLAVGNWPGGGALVKMTAAPREFLHPVGSTGFL